jgi:hypothetical protein
MHSIEKNGTFSQTLRFDDAHPHVVDDHVDRSSSVTTRSMSADGADAPHRRARFVIRGGHG